MVVFPEAKTQLWEPFFREIILLGNLPSGKLLFWEPSTGINPLGNLLRFECASRTATILSSFLRVIHYIFEEKCLKVKLIKTINIVRRISERHMGSPSKNAFWVKDLTLNYSCKKKRFCSIFLIINVGKTKKNILRKC